MSSTNIKLSVILFGREINYVYVFYVYDDGDNDDDDGDDSDTRG